MDPHNCLLKGKTQNVGRIIASAVEPRMRQLLCAVADGIDDTDSDSGVDRGAQAMRNGGVLRYVGVRRGAGNEGIRLKMDRYHYLPQHFLYFRPLPQGHGSLRPALTLTGTPSPRTSGMRGWDACWRDTADSSTMNGLQ